MLFEDFRLHHWLGHLRRKKKILYFEDAVSWQKQVRKINTVCICMPRDHKYFYEARDCVSEVRRPGVTITMVVNPVQDALTEHRGPLAHYPLQLKKPFPVREEDIGEIPKKFDVTLDLSPQPSPLTAYITASRAEKLSIGMHSEKLNAFYTVLVKPSDDYIDAVTTALSLAGLL
jgi:hypothetical protein